MHLLTVTNLYPRPDDPRRGLFNARLFVALAAQLHESGALPSPRLRRAGKSQESVGLSVLVLVPEWRPWRWAAIRAWCVPGDTPATKNIATRYVPVFYLPGIGRNIAWWFHARALRRHRILFEKCDAVLATWLYPDATAAGIVAREHEKPFWVKLHGTDRFHLDHPVRGRVIRVAMEEAAGFFPNAQFLADSLTQQGIPGERVHVVRHGVDSGRFRPRPKDDAWKQISRMHSAADLPSLPVLLYVGHLKKIKGPDRLMAAFAELVHSEVPAPPAPLTLVFIGDGPKRSDLDRLAGTLGVVDRVRFLGARPPEEVALWMNVAGCLCLPSRSEGMPNVVLEALASGCPVVATDVGDVRAVVHEPQGIVVANGEDCAQQMAAGIRRVLLAEGSTTPARAAGIFGWTDSAARLLEIIAM